MGTTTNIQDERVDIRGSTENGLLEDVAKVRSHPWWIWKASTAEVKNDVAELQALGKWLNGEGFERPSQMALDR